MSIVPLIAVVIYNICSNGTGSICVSILVSKLVIWVPFNSPLLCTYELREAKCPDRIGGTQNLLRSNRQDKRQRDVKNAAAVATSNHTVLLH